MSEELWYVKLANGDVHRVTLDQLDGAFQAGHIDENTMVLGAGASTWSKLGDLAGLDGESSAPEGEGQPLPEAHAQPAPTYSPAPVPARPVAVAAPAAAHAPVHTAPAAARPVVAAAPPPAYVANSLRPLSFDLGDADLDAPFRRSARSARKRAAVALLGIAAVAGGVGVAAQQGRLNFGGGGSELSNAAAAAAMSPPPAADPVVPAPVAAPPAAPTPAPGAQTNSAPAGEGSPLNPQFTTRFNEDTKQKLIAADKTRDQKAKTRHVGGASTSSSKSKSTSFTTGGSKFDPLNSSI